MPACLEVSDPGVAHLGEHAAMLVMVPVPGHCHGGGCPLGSRWRKTPDPSFQCLDFDPSLYNHTELVLNLGHLLTVYVENISKLSAPQFPHL